MNREYLRFKWNHQSSIHRYAVKVFTTLMQGVPFSIKYGIGQRIRKQQLPYTLIKNAKVVVQIGAPRDTLISGRSRGMYFGLFSSPDCHVVIVEPDPDSVRAFEDVLHHRRMDHVTVIPMGAWSEKKMLKIYINDSHPASNFTEDCKDYDEDRLREYRVVEIPANTVDNMLADQGIIGQVDLVSITTNGAEKNILAGMSNTIEAGLPYIALARTGTDLIEHMATLGYSLFAHDDRGYTFKQNG
jgi:FkbM family methyltransferase